MPLILTWMRECDEIHFARHLRKFPTLSVLNARLDATNRAADAAGLLLTGGPDISNIFLNQAAAPERTLSANEERDLWEFSALKFFLETGKPVLGICKGMQVLNVVLGGTLHPHIDGHDRPEDAFRNSQPLKHSKQSVHRFSHVNSSHHQAIDRIGSGLEVHAWCSEDDVIEQVNLVGHRFVSGVQYHPERDLLYESLFLSFFDAIAEK